MVELIFFPILLIGPFAYAIFILRKLDQAAQQRKKLVSETKFRFMLVDVFSLILLIQMPFKILSLDIGAGTVQVLLFFSLVALALVWFTTIKTVSIAGIATFKWRALVSMILIPTMYIGCFYFSITSISWLTGSPMSAEMIIWLGVSLAGMVFSPWIIRGALNSVSQHQTLQRESKAPDPFAD